MATIPCKYCRVAVSPIASRCVHCRRVLLYGLFESLLGMEGIAVIIGSMAILTGR